MLKFDENMSTTFQDRVNSVQHTRTYKRVSDLQMDAKTLLTYNAASHYVGGSIIKGSWECYVLSQLNPQLQNLAAATEKFMAAENPLKMQLTTI